MKSKLSWTEQSVCAPRQWGAYWCAFAAVLTTGKHISERAIVHCTVKHLAWLTCVVCVFVCHTYKKVDSKLQFRGDCSDTNYLLHMPERNRKWQTHTNIWQSHGAPQFIRFIFQCDWNDDCAETCITCARMRFHSNKRFHSSWRWWRSCFVVISLYIYILDVFIKATLMAKIW